MSQLWDKGGVPLDERVLHGPVHDRVHRPALAQALERKLFDRGCAVFVLKVERRDAAAALAAAGILVLLLDGPDALPDDDVEAVDEIIRRLETQTILRSTNVIHEGEGI